MDAIALSGRHPNTSSWMLSVLDSLGIPGGSLRRYRHWATEGEPGGGAAALKQALGAGIGEVVSVPGSDHLYRDVQELARIVLAWPAFARAPS